MSVDLFNPLRDAGALRQAANGLDFIGECPACGGLLTAAVLGDTETPRVRCASGCGADAIGRGVVVVAQTRYPTTTTPHESGGARRRAEAHIRPIDMAAALARPPKPVRWRLDQFARDGALTITAAKGGAGKSWLGMAACQAVTAGTHLGPIPAEQGRAVYVDGEMGEEMMVDRFRSAGLAPDAFDYIDATGLNLGDETAVEALADHLRTLVPNLVVLDSLRRLAPGKRENESDDIAPMVSRLAVMARELDAAVLLLHHAGHDGSRFIRGSSAIIDQADAVFGLVAGGGVLTLSADPERGGKMRMARTPEDRHLQLAIGGGVVVVGALTPATTTPLAKPDAVDDAKAAILAALGAATVPLPGKAAVATATRLNAENKSFRTAWTSLRDSGQMILAEAGWTLDATMVAAPAEPGGATIPTDARKAPPLAADPDPHLALPMDWHEAPARVAS